MTRTEQLEQMIRELRVCLEECAAPEDGWPHTWIADTFEESRKLVPDDDEDATEPVR